MKTTNIFEVGALAVPVAPNPDKDKRIHDFLKNYTMIPVTANNPQFPGQQIAPGLSIDQIRNWIKRQKRIKGFNLNTSMGGANNFDIKLPGTAKMLLGFVLYNPSFLPDDNLTFTVNNEIIIESMNPVFFTELFTDEEYYFIPRPLNGSDQINLQIARPSGSGLINSAFYYI